MKKLCVRLVMSVMLVSSLQMVASQESMDLEMAKLASQTPTLIDEMVVAGNNAFDTMISSVKEATTAIQKARVDRRRARFTIEKIKQQHMQQILNAKKAQLDAQAAQKAAATAPVVVKESPAAAPASINAPVKPAAPAKPAPVVAAKKPSTSSTLKWIAVGSSVAWATATAFIAFKAWKQNKKDAATSGKDANKIKEQKKAAIKNAAKKSGIVAGVCSGIGALAWVALA